jgi:hypothetical protein
MVVLMKKPRLKISRKSTVLLTSVLLHTLHGQNAHIETVGKSGPACTLRVDSQLSCFYSPIMQRKLNLPHIRSWTLTDYP